MSFASSVLNKQVIVNPSLSAAQWQLYTDLLPGVTAAADKLNEALRVSVNEGLPRWRCAQRVQLVMQAESAFGANDTGPRYILEDLLNEIFGE